MGTVGAPACRRLDEGGAARRRGSDGYHVRPISPGVIWKTTPCPSPPSRSRIVARLLRLSARGEGRRPSWKKKLSAWCSSWAGAQASGAWTVHHPGRCNGDSTGSGAGDYVPGVKLVHVGDAGRTDDLVEVCRNADALIIEATYTSDEAEMAARLATSLPPNPQSWQPKPVWSIFSWCISPALCERDVLREARAIFSNTIVPQTWTTTASVGYCGTGGWTS